MYQAIKKHQTTTNIYEKKIIKENIINSDQAQKIKKDFKNFLDAELEGAKSYKPNKADWLEGDWAGLSTASFDERRGVTSVKENDLLEIGKAIHEIPKDFNAGNFGETAKKIVDAVNKEKK